MFSIKNYCKLFRKICWIGMIGLVIGLFTSASYASDTFNVVVDFYKDNTGTYSAGDTGSISGKTLNWVGSIGNADTGNLDAQSVMKFDLSRIAGNVNVSNAVLKIHIGYVNSADGGSIDVYRTNDDSCIESDTSEVPVTTGLITTRSLVGIVENTDVFLDVTSFVKSQVENGGDKVVTIVLKGKETGEAGILYHCSEETDVNLRPILSVDYSTVNSTINPTTANFDKKTVAQLDVATTMILGGNSLSSIVNGVTPLVLNTDYTVSGNTVTIKKSYLAAQSVGTTNLTFSFSEGATQTLTITVSDSTPSAPIVTTDAANSISTTGATLNGTVNANNDSTTVTFEYGTTTGYGSTVTATESPVTGATPTSVSKAITGLAPNTTYHYRVVGVNSAGTTNGSDQTFTTTAVVATVTTNAANSIGATGVTLNGTVNANNDSTTVTFEYGTTTGYGSTVTATESPVTGATPTSVSKAVTGLAPNTTYHYRVVGVNSAGTTNGSDQTFTTTAAVPTATTNAANSISITGATLNGTVNAKNDSTTVTFEYGTTTGYGSTVTATESPVTGATPTSVSKAITGLAPNTTYHYRVVGVNSAGTTNGSDQTFTTTAAVPTATTNAANSISTTGATLNGTVNAKNDSTTVTFEYGTTTGYGSTVTATESPVTGATPTSVSKAITGLAPNTTYHYRVVGVNSAGTMNGSDQTFTTTAVVATVTTNAANSIGATGVTLNGTVNAKNDSTTVTFEYGTTTGYGTSVAATPGTVTGTSATSVSKVLTGLAPNTTYHYRVVGVNSAGTTNGSDQTFTTTAVVATVTTNAANSIGATGVTLNGTVNANNDSTTVTFEYGTTTGYGSTVTATESPVTGATPTSVSKAITDLAPNTTYHYRVVGVNGAGTTNGSDQTFTTTAAVPTATTNAANSISTTGATLNGTVNAKNDSTTVTFEYGTTTGYGTSVAATPGTVTGTSATSVSKVLTGLAPNTTYHYRVVGVNSAGTTTGSNQTFTTSTELPTTDLTDLDLSGSPTGYTFASGTYAYNNITVANDISVIRVIPTGAGTITVDGTLVDSGNASGAIELTEGIEKTITVVVTESGKSSITYVLKVTRAMTQQAPPTFTPSSGSIIYGSTVTITSTGADAIYYTTDGTIPANSVTGTTLAYTNPITIDTAKTIKAIAVKSGKLDSNVATATYGQSVSADLTDLALSGNPSNYNFNGSIYAYNGIGVANEVSEITIKPTGAGDITVNGTTVVTNTSSAAITLDVGVEKTIDVTVSESGKASKTYTLNVTRSQPNITAPSAPTNVTATAGNQQAVISFNVPANNGGSAITGYTVISSPGAITVTGSASPITVTGLTNGTSYVFKVTATNAAGTSADSADSSAVVPTAPANNNEDRPTRPEPSSPSTPSAPSTAPTTPVVPKPSGVDILVNGKVETAAVSETKTVNNQVVTTVTVDAQKVDAKLASEGRNTIITIPVNGKNDVAIGTLNGQTVKNMESKDAVLEIKTANVVYTLPASQINIDAISSAIGTQVALKDITVDVKISQPSAQTIQTVENTANKNNYQVVVKPVDFDITCSNGGKTVEVSKFNAYVERMVAIPDGVDPSKITTGIVLNADGSFSHVPTNIIKQNDKYFAKINSLTNSSYSVIWSPKTFADAEKHWAKTAINDMGSRLIVTGTTEQSYEPDRAVTRAEFAEILVKGLGLKRPGAGKDAFADVKVANWYYDSVSTATEFGLISGYGNGIFGANDQITREQAVTMLQKAMKLTALNVALSDAEQAQILNQFKDSDKASAWAKDALATNVKAGIMGGKNDMQLAPKAAITRAEVAVLVRNLLMKSNLINN